MRSINIALAAVILGLLASPAQANQRASDLPIATAAATSGEARPPIGYIGYCVRYPGECTGHSTDRPVKLDQAAWALLKRVNDEVNRRIQPVTDKDHWGVAERWDLPSDGKGDCEDLQLLKRKLLMDAGMPRQTLLMTVVRDTHGEGHAVLMVRTDRGDMILDSRTSTIKPWQKTSYKFIKRQSQDNQNNWVYFGDGTDSLTTASQAR